MSPNYYGHDPCFQNSQDCSRALCTKLEINPTARGRLQNKTQTAEHVILQQSYASITEFT